MRGKIFFMSIDEKIEMITDSDDLYLFICDHLCLF